MTDFAAGELRGWAAKTRQSGIMDSKGRPPARPFSGFQALRPRPLLQPGGTTGRGRAPITCACLLTRLDSSSRRSTEQARREIPTSAIVRGAKANALGSPCLTLALVDAKFCTVSEVRSGLKLARTQCADAGG